MKKTFQALALYAGLTASSEALSANGHQITTKFCQVVKMHGAKSWQALSEYDAGLAVHGGENFYLMDNEQLRKALEKKMVVLTGPLRERILDNQTRIYEVFQNKSDEQKVKHLENELMKHGVKASEAVAAAQECSR